MRPTYVQNPPYFADMTPTPEPLTDIIGARILGLFLDSITTDHISPAGSIKRDGPAGRLPDRAPGAAGRLQLLRRAARQPRSDDARHLRQHPHQEPDGAGRRRRRDHPLPLRRADVDLRRGHALRRGEGAARHLRRQGIRHRLLARLGGQGNAAARRARRDRAELRAHPPLQPRRHGRPAAGAGGGHELAEPRPEGRRDGHHPRHRRPEAAAGRDGGDRVRRRPARRTSRCWSESTRSTSSNISATAASCTTCCATSSRKRRRGPARLL